MGVWDTLAQPSASFPAGPMFNSKRVVNLELSGDMAAPGAGTLELHQLAGILGIPGHPNISPTFPAGKEKLYLHETSQTMAFVVGPGEIVYSRKDTRQSGHDALYILPVDNDTALFSKANNAFCRIREIPYV